MRATWWLALVGSVAVSVATAAPAVAGDGAGFYWGTDGNGPAPVSSGNTCSSDAVPYLEPDVTSNGASSGCGKYGFYATELGGWWTTLGCSGTNASNQAAADDANANQTANGYGLGMTGYWFSGGPGMDPNYDSNATLQSQQNEAYSWGQTQAAEAVSSANNHPKITFFAIFFDVDSSTSEGWNSVYTGGCALNRVGKSIDYSVARSEFNGFVAYVQNTPTWWRAVYASPGNWASDFGTGSYGSLSNTMEWVAHYNHYCVNPPPTGWNTDCAGDNPDFFAGIPDGCKLGWQWANINTSSDYDQIDFNNAYICA